MYQHLTDITPTKKHYHTNIRLTSTSVQHQTKIILTSVQHQSKTRSASNQHRTNITLTSHQHHTNNGQKKYQTKIRQKLDQHKIRRKYLNTLNKLHMSVSRIVQQYLTIFSISQHVSQYCNMKIFYNIWYCLIISNNTS